MWQCIRGYSWVFVEGASVPPGFPNLGPISVQKMSFSLPVFTPDLSIRIFFFLPFSFEIEMIIRSYTPIVLSKTIPDSRPEQAKWKPIFRPKRQKNPTRWGGTYQYWLYMGVLPSWRCISWVIFVSKKQFISNLALKTLKSPQLGVPSRSRHNKVWSSIIRKLCSQSVFWISWIRTVKLMAGIFRLPKTEIRNRDSGNPKSAIGNGQWAMGNGQWAMGNGKSEIKHPPVQRHVTWRHNLAT